MTEASYKGVRIQLRVFELADEEGFTAHFTLVKSIGGSVQETPYYPERTFTTKELARSADLLEAQSIIDRES